MNSHSQLRPLAVARAVAVVIGAVLRGFSIVAACLGVLLVLPRIFDAQTLARDPHGGAFMTIGGIVILGFACGLWVVGKLLGLAGGQSTSRATGRLEHESSRQAP